MERFQQHNNSNDSSSSDLIGASYSYSAAALFFVLFIVSLYFMRRRPNNYPRGPIGLPFIGNLHQLTSHPFIKFMELRKKYGDIFAIDFASYRGIVINDPKLIHEALSMSEFNGRPKLRPLLERNNDGQLRGLILGEGPSHTYLRRFTLRHLRNFGFGKESMSGIIQDEMEEMLNTFTKLELEGKPFVTKSIFNAFAINSLWWITIGERFKHDDEKLKEISIKFEEAIVDSPAAGVYFFFPWLTRLAPNLTGYNTHLSFQHDHLRLIRDKYHELKATFTSGHHRHLLDIYIQELEDAKDPTSIFYGEEGEKNLVAAVTDLFEAGIETTSTTMSWAVMLLALHPEVQDRMYAEVKAVTNLTRAPTLDDEPNLPYIQAVLHEVLRFSSIVPMSVFHATIQDVTFHGYKIPKDTLVMPNLYAAHHDRNVWGDPEIFRPERFISHPEGIFIKPGDAFMPFSVGKRRCIGEPLARNTVFLFLATIFLHYKILPNPDKPTPIVDYIPCFVLKPKPYEYVLESRPK